MANLSPATRHEFYYRRLIPRRYPLENPHLLRLLSASSRLACLLEVLTSLEQLTYPKRFRYTELVPVRRLTRIEFSILSSLDYGSCPFSFCISYIDASKLHEFAPTARPTKVQLICADNSCGSPQEPYTTRKVALFNLHSELNMLPQKEEFAA